MKSLDHNLSTGNQKSALLFREHNLINPLISRILESLGYGLIFFEELDLSLPSMVTPSVIMLDDCMVADILLQNITVLKTYFDAPVIFLTHAYFRQVEQDQVILVCDDFILKPFNLEELKLRMEFIIRRYGNVTRNQLKPSLVERRQKLKASTVTLKSYFYIDKGARVVYVEGQAVHLTPKEYQLFCLLSENPGQLHSTEIIIQYLWRNNKMATPNDVQQIIYCLRKKIEQNPTNPCFLHNVPGYGYKLEFLPESRSKQHPKL
ncbi:MAG: response regulator transcription factor [Methylococcales bacterium]